MGVLSRFPSTSPKPFRKAPSEPSSNKRASRRKTFFASLNEGGRNVRFVLAWSSPHPDAVTGTPRRAAAHEAFAARVAECPNQISHALEAEHRVIDEEGDHLHAIVGIGGSGSREGSHESEVVEPSRGRHRSPSTGVKSQRVDTDTGGREAKREELDGRGLFGANRGDAPG